MGFEKCDVLKHWLPLNQEGGLFKQKKQVLSIEQTNVLSWRLDDIVSQLMKCMGSHCGTNRKKAAKLSTCVDIEGSRISHADLLAKHFWDRWLLLWWCCRSKWQWQQWHKMRHDDKLAWQEETGNSFKTFVLTAQFWAQKTTFAHLSLPLATFKWTSSAPKTKLNHGCLCNLD